MNKDLPVNLDPSLDLFQEKGTITYATEVIATIVGVATAEVEGISSMAGAASISELFSGKAKNFSRGVRVEVGAEEVAVDVSVIVDYGMPIQSVGCNVQENIRKSIETMTGLHVLKVDVHVLGVSFEKENKELEQGQEVARLQSVHDNPRFGGVLREGTDIEETKPTSKQKKAAKEEKIKEEKAKKKEAYAERSAEEAQTAVEEDLSDPPEEEVPEEVSAVTPEADAETMTEAMAEAMTEAVSEAVTEADAFEFTVTEELVEPSESATTDKLAELDEPQSDGKKKGGNKNKKDRGGQGDDLDESPHM